MRPSVALLLIILQASQDPLVAKTSNGVWRRALSSPHSPQSQLADTAKSLTSATVGLFKKSMKAAVHAMSPKYVSMNELLGTWRLEQTLFDDESALDTTEALTVRFFRNGTISSKTGRFDFSFVSRAWPRYCTITFKVPFQVSSDAGRPIILTYNGYFERPPLSSEMVILRGTVHCTKGAFL